MKFRKYASNKVIAIITAIMVVLGGFWNQHHKIKQLEKELYIQQNMTDQKYNYSETHIDISTLEKRLNNECNFKVLDGTINVKHTYVYQRDSILGLKSKCKLVGTADFYYSVIVNLSKVKITKANDKKIVMEVPAAKIDEDACHRVANTFIRMDEDCDDNLLAKKDDVEKATRQWEDTFDVKGLQYVKEYFDYPDIQEQTQDAIVHQIEKLMEELGYPQGLELIFR